MLVFLLTLLVGVTSASADPGDLDPSFGDGGVARVAISGSAPGTSTAGVIQADGKVVTVGRTDGGDFAVARFARDGGLDSGFSGDGRLTLYSAALTGPRRSSSSRTGNCSWPAGAGADRWSCG